MFIVLGRSGPTCDACPLYLRFHKAAGAESVFCRGEGSMRKPYNFHPFLPSLSFSPEPEWQCPIFNL